MLILSAEDSHVKMLALQESGLDWLAQEVDYSSTLCVSRRTPKQKLSSWRMSQDFFQATKDAISEQSSLHWPTQGIATSNGVCLIRNSSEFPNDAKESSLSQVLEQGGGRHLDRYLLSAKAAQGILYRANKMDKRLPEMLQTVLERVANVDV